MKGPTSFLFIEAFLDKQDHLKTLLKKVVGNVIVQEAFQEYLISENLINRAMNSEIKFISDLILMNILDQLWI
jgi:hypothetical protein